MNWPTSTLRLATNLVEKPVGSRLWSTDQEEALFNLVWY
jgi:hypothetical protein